MTGGVRDLAFSPNLGRSFDLLAVAGAQLTILLIRYLRGEGSNKSVILRDMLQSLKLKFTMLKIHPLKSVVTGLVEKISHDIGDVFSRCYR